MDIQPVSTQVFIADPPQVIEPVRLDFIRVEDHSLPAITGEENQKNVPSIDEAVGRTLDITA